jgi:antitoxin (DNA-binding transcriptional repressor) of toxin-antitoxin stability system
MPAYDLEYAEEHLAELFHEARLGEEVIIVRDDGRSCALTPLAESPADEPFAIGADLPNESEAPSGQPVPA